MSSSPLIWFLLLDSATGKPFKGTSASSILRSLLAVPVVDQFREAVKAKHPNKLLSVDATDLLVYKNKTAFEKRDAAGDEKEGPLDVESVVDDFGKSKDEALVIAVPATETSGSLTTPVSEKLKQLGVDFSIRDINYLLNNDTAKYSFLKAPGLTAWEAKSILTSAKSKIKSATEKSIGLQHKFFLDGCLNVGQGQGKSSLYYAFSESGGVLVAKVYNGHKDDFDREVNVSKALNHKNLVKFIKTFSIQNGARHIIIMPFFPRSVADWMNQHCAIPLAAIRVIARNCFDALCHLHAQGFCFADLKPANIMLQNAEQGHATLIDYGATVRINDPIIECTKQYCLDADTSMATEHLDWICLGTTLAQIGGFELNNDLRIVDLINGVRGSSLDGHLKQLIVACLQTPSSSKIESALNQLETKTQ